MHIILFHPMISYNAAFYYTIWLIAFAIYYLFINKRHIVVRIPYAVNNTGVYVNNVEDVEVASNVEDTEVASNVEDTEVASNVEDTEVASNTDSDTETEPASSDVDSDDSTDENEMVPDTNDMDVNDVQYASKKNIIRNRRTTINNAYNEYLNNKDNSKM